MCFLLFLTLFFVLGLFVACKKEVSVVEPIYEKDAYVFALKLSKNELYCSVEISHTASDNYDSAVFRMPNVGEIRVRVDGEDKDCERVGDALKVFSTLERGSRKTYGFEYVVSLKDKGATYGLADGVYYAREFYPVSSECAKGCENFSYTAEFTLPKNMVAICAGKEISDVKSDASRELRLEGENIRDFSFVASSSIVNRNQGNIHYYYRSDKKPQIALGIASNALDVFKTLYGKYLNELNVIKVPFSENCYVGSGVIWIKDGMSEEECERTIVRAVAGEWFGYVLGSDSETSPYLSESLRGFSLLIYYLKSENGKSFERLKSEFERTLEKRVISAKNNAVGLKKGEYGEEIEECVFQIGALMWFGLYCNYGADVLIRLSELVENNAYSAIDKAALYSAFDLSEYTVYLDAWLSGNAVHAL